MLDPVKSQAVIFVNRTRITSPRSERNKPKRGGREKKKKKYGTERKEKSKRARERKSKDKKKRTELKRDTFLFRLFLLKLNSHNSQKRDTK